MTALFLLSGAALGLTVWAYYHRLPRANDLGCVSAQWLHQYRSDSRQHG